MMRTFVAAMAVLASPSLGQILVDPDGVGANDVEARPLGSADPFVPLPMDATGSFNPGDALELRVGSVADGSILFQDAGPLTFGAGIGQIGGGAGRMVLRGDTTVTAAPVESMLWLVGVEGTGELVLEDGAALLSADERVNLRFGRDQPAHVVVRSASTLSLLNQDVYLGSGGALPLDGRESVLLVEGEGTTAEFNTLRAGGSMNTLITVRDGAVVSTGRAGEFVLGTAFAGNMAPVTVETRMHVDGVTVALGNTVVLGSAQNASVVVKNGGRLVSTRDVRARSGQYLPSGDEPLLDVSVTVTGPESSIDFSSLRTDDLSNVTLEVLDGASAIIEAIVPGRPEFGPASLTLRVSGDGSSLEGSDGQLVAGNVRGTNVHVGPSGTIGISTIDFGFQGADSLTVELEAIDVGGAARFVSRSLTAGGVLGFDIVDDVTLEVGDSFDSMTLRHSRIRGLK